MSTVDVHPRGFCIIMSSGEGYCNVSTVDVHPRGFCIIMSSGGKSRQSYENDMMHNTLRIIGLFFKFDSASKHITLC